MQLPELCIRRPVMTTLLMAAFLIFGIMAYRALPVSELPSIDFPTISVTAQLPGASPETMAAAVATPLEGQFSTISGLDSMTSTSAQGTSTITLQFGLDRDIDAAAQDVQSAISAVQRRLPRDMPNPPSFRKSNPADDSVLLLALSEEERHGYALARAMADRTNGLITLEPGNLYRIIRRMEEEGLVAPSNRRVARRSPGSAIIASRPSRTASAAATFSRATAFMSGATESSVSKMMASHGSVFAFSRALSFAPGM